MCSKTIRASIRWIMTAYLVLMAWQLIAVPVPLGEEPDLKAEFLKVCDANLKFIVEQTQATERQGHRAHYQDSYAVRAMCAAYDMTEKLEYLDACKRWSDRMIELQDRMIPKGAYYMQYGRKPGENKGDWYVADRSSISLGVLATSIRCEDPVEKAKYLNSVKSFAKLVINNFVRPDLPPFFGPRSMRGFHSPVLHRALARAA